jgi:predicted dehydrogenase
VVTGGWHNRGDYPFSMEYTIVTQRGTFDYNSAGRPPTLYHAGGEEEPLAQPGKDGYQAEIEYFVDCCIHNRRPGLCPPEQSATAVKIAQLMQRAREANGEKLPCKL